ncbi:hypothetical protein C3L33_04106, partial [Rhododendron williamsianum]
MIIKKDWESERIKQHADAIRSMLGSMGDGEISVSAYDTAWVALLEDKEGSGAPQFPSSLQWIANNQHQDGSWGDSSIFEAHDRIINTLVCVIALKSWNIHPDKSEKGLSFIKENINKLEDEDAEHMPIGFEVAFPSLIERARKLDIQVPDDSDPILQEIYARRNLKLTRIPKDIMHKVATTLLHSLEGLMHGLEWEKLLKLQCPDGSFLFSPSSTAFALMETKDDNCLRYLTTAVQKFNGGVPNVYPVDLFEHMWAVDRLERLGISRYFKSEIRECVDYVHRYWTEEGICWARNSVVHDIDDTSMGFRLLRLHGYPVSADVFGHFKKGGEFFCFAGQSTQAVTGMYNLYRASIFEPERSIERMAWAKAAILVEAIVAYFQKEGSSSEQRGAFVREFKNWGGQVRDKDDCDDTTIQIESDMQELVQSVLCSSPDDIDPIIKQTFLAVAKSYYYNAHCTPVTIHFHIAKVLFERVI